jgi:hypothetical protein
MKKQAILGILIAATVLQASTPALASSDGEKIAAGIIGGIIGGLIGSQIDDQNGQPPPPENFDRHHRPDRRHGGPDRFPDRPHRPPPPPPPPGRDDRDGVGSVQIDGVLRRAGGTWYRLTLQQPMAVSNIEVRVLSAAVKLHEAALVTDRNERIQIYDLSNTPVLNQGFLAGAYINRNDRVVAIDIRAESFGAFADLQVDVSSPEGYPRLRVTQF